MYSKLNDADSIKGIIAVHNNDPSPQEMILLHEVNGQLQVIKNILKCIYHQFLEQILIVNITQLSKLKMIS